MTNPDNKHGNGWTNVRLRFVAEVNSLAPPRSILTDDTLVSFLPMEAIGKDGSLRLETDRPVAELRAGYSYFADGDVAFAKVTPFFENGKGALMRGLTRGVGFGTTEVTVLRPGPNLHAGFLNYFVNSLVFRQPGAGAMQGAGGLKRVPDEFTRNSVLPLPPVQVQRSVVNFLDRETARIDGLIEKKTRFIELLREKRQALITQAVSGWPSRPVKFASDFRTSGPRGWSELIVEGAPSAFVQSGDLNDEMGLELESAARINVPDGAEADRTRLHAGDVVVCITGANTGRVALAKESAVPAFVNQHLCLVRPSPAVLIPTYLALVLHSRIGRDYFESRQYGLKEGLNLSDVGDAQIPIPPLARQRRIVARCTSQTSTIQRLIDAAERSARLLKERRAALITAAVTGQIDAREAA